MLCKYKLNGEIVDSIELKALLVTKGINISGDRLHERFGHAHRIAPPSDLRACNCLLLPDKTNGLAEIYLKYGVEPPGDAGFNVCLCRDVWNHRSECCS